MQRHDAQHENNEPSHTFLAQENVPLADKNWFGTGGNARFYCTPTTDLEFAQALSFATDNNLKTFILGQGANILISDDGFDGLVIAPQLKQITILNQDNNTAHITAGAGVTMHELITFCLNNNLLSLEEFSGIPGTVGGAVYINLHYYEFLLEQFLIHAKVICKKTNKILSVDRSWFEFGYDQSKLQSKKHYLLEATFTCKKATDLETAKAAGRHEEIIRHRTKRYPHIGTCGSFFRNFLPEEVAKTEKQLIFVAYYLDKLGIKGELQVGDAIVSHQHANMIVNKGNATSSDIIKLTTTMQEMVYKKFGIKPQPECQLIGFSKNPFTK